MEIKTGLGWETDFLFPVTELYQNTKKAVEVTVCCLISYLWAFIILVYQVTSDELPKQ